MKQSSVLESWMWSPGVNFFMMVITLTAGTCAVARWVLLLSETESIPSIQQEKKEYIRWQCASRTVTCLRWEHASSRGEWATWVCLLRHRYLWVCDYLWMCRYLCCYSLDPRPKTALHIEKIGDVIDNQHRFVYTNVFSSLKTRNKISYSNFGFGVPESIFSWRW